MNRYIIYEDPITETAKIISRSEFYQVYSTCRMIDSVNTFEKAKRIQQQINKINPQNYMIIRGLLNEGANKETVCSHVITFYCRTKELGKGTIGRIQECFDVENPCVSKHVQGGIKTFKASIDVHEEDVCDIICMLSAEKKPAFVHSIDSAKQFAQESKLLRKRFFRDFRYLCAVRLDEQGQSFTSLRAEIENGKVFSDSLIAKTYLGLAQRISADNIKRMALSILDKLEMRLSEKETERYTYV